jgi:hypothetical protein
MKLEDIPNLAFRQLAASLSPDLQPSSPRTFELCLRQDGLPVRISLHPDQQRVIMQAYAYDLSMVLGPLRANLLQTLLLINRAALQGRPFSVGLDNRDFVCLTRIQQLDRAIGDDFLDDLDYLLQQAEQIRILVTNLTLQGGNMDFNPEPVLEGVE